MVYEMNTIGKSAFWLGVARLSSGLRLGEEPGVVVSVEYSSRTLSRCWQLCRKCTIPTTSKHSPPWIRRRHQRSVTDIPEKGRKALSQGEPENQRNASSHPL